MEAKKRFIYDDFRMSQEKLTEGWTMPYSHYHAAYEIYVLEYGERTVTIGDKEYTARAHDATLFEPDIPHKSKGVTEFSGICIHFTERYLDLYFSPEAKKYMMKCFEHKLISIDDDGFAFIKNAADEYSPACSGNFLILADILNILCRCCHDNDDTETSHTQKKTKKSQLIIDYVNENYVYIKRINDITELFGVTENYIFQIFRRHYGMTPKQYINMLRIKHACHRLRYADKSIKSIALECGYGSYEYFINVFKQTMGCTPSQYRINEKSEL